MRLAVRCVARNDSLWRKCFPQNVGEVVRCYFMLMVGSIEEGKYRMSEVVLGWPFAPFGSCEPGRYFLYEARLARKSTKGD